ncbi:ATP-binding cassette domain-containing protein [Actinomyces sp. B33]|uniref:ABC transporter ATP-binding protein n=1 Tax=Actinomyces sp. B33 TaxID=2942131 RepID=UPI00233F8F14|nr:ATP-binding cassette domain-containing protein [Actinomyces sp. B33]MDC4233440.1 ATP-binding cassette domain-containing protein [Actinomyces sp. B33]
MLDIEAVTKTFFRGTVNERVALSDVSLHLDEGDFVTVIGSNGAGKSTLLNIVSGRYQADIGRITIGGRDTTRMPDWRTARLVSRVFQDPMAGTAPHLTIEENLSLAYSRGRARGFGPALTRRRRKLLREVLAPLEQGLEDRLTTKAGLLSGGQRQALSLTMATFSNPRVLLLDEHTAALDPARAALIARLTDEAVARQGLTTLMVTHNMEQALSMGNRLIMMHEGRIVFELSGRAKEEATIESLLAEFEHLRGGVGPGMSDRTLLA